jgi:preprotein translocase subunit YajC
MENMFQSLTQIAPVIAIFGAAYFILFRPQQQKMKAHQDLLSRLTIGDRIMTSGGVLGTVDKLEGDLVHVSIASGVVIKVRKSHITEVLPNSPSAHVTAHPSDKKTVEPSETQKVAPSDERPKRKASPAAKKEGPAKTSTRPAAKKSQDKSKS